MANSETGNAKDANIQTPKTIEQNQILRAVWILGVLDFWNLDIGILGFCNVGCLDFGFVRCCLVCVFGILFLFFAYICSF